MATLPRGVPKCLWPHCGRKKRAGDDFFVKYPCHTHKYESGASNLYQKKLKTCKERPFLQAGNLILEMRSKTGQCHPVCHLDFSRMELHISLQSDHYPARRSFFNGYHPYKRKICSLSYMTNISAAFIQNNSYGTRAAAQRSDWAVKLETAASRRQRAKGNKEIEMFSVYFFVNFFANFWGNFCIEYFSAIFCVKNVIFFAQCKIFHRKMGKISQKNLQ